MIKIIRPGYKKEVECQKCGAILSYDEKVDVLTSVSKTLTESIGLDLYKSHKKYIICPQCKHEIILETTK